MPEALLSHCKLILPGCINLSCVVCLQVLSLPRLWFREKGKAVGVGANVFAASPRPAYNPFSVWCEDSCRFATAKISCALKTTVKLHPQKEASFIPFGERFGIRSQTRSPDWRCNNSLNNSCTRYFLKWREMVLLTGLFVQNAHGISITTSKDVRGLL